MSEASVIIPAYGYCPHLVGLIRTLVNGQTQPAEIIVAHSGSDDPTPDIEAISDIVTVLHYSERLLAGAARNRGAAIATGTWIAFIDADVQPRPDWLEVLTTSIANRPSLFVVGSVGYSTTGGYWGLCNWLCEFSEQAPWHAARRQTGGASCNMILSASDFREVGGFPEDHQPGEDTILFSRLARKGQEQWFEPTARVDHFNQPGLGRFLRHQYSLGYCSALARKQAPLRGSLATRIWPLALTLWVPRLALIAGRLGRGGPRWWARGTILGPGLLLGSLVWTAGFLKRLLERQPARESIRSDGCRNSMGRNPTG